MSAARNVAKPPARTFEAVLERTQDRLQWVIMRVPFDAARLWGKRGQLRVQGEINGFSFRSTLFPNGKGGHFMIVNKKMQSGGRTAPGLTAKFRLAPDATPRQPVPPATELLLELKRSRRLLTFYESLPNSWKNDLARWIAQSKQEATRKRRASQLAERLLETMEAERDLPPQIAIALAQNPKARTAWEKVQPSRRRRHLLAIFHYRNPESRARRIAKFVEEISGAAKRQSGRRAEDWDYS